MSVNSKDIATFLLGAAAGFAAYKYTNMTEEEKEKMMNDIKTKAKNFKNDAEGMAEKAKEYFGDGVFPKRSLMTPSMSPTCSFNAELPFFLSSSKYSKLFRKINTCKI